MSVPQFDFLEASLPAARRSRLLLAHMTLQEKIGQLCQYVGETASHSGPNQSIENADEVVGYSLELGDIVTLIQSGRVGSFLKVPGALEANYLQEVAASTRLHIPLLIATDAIHGHGMDVRGTTIFPSPIALAASFDPDLARRVAECTAREMRATGFHWSFSPNVDVVRDPRWGRTGETFGEDPCLIGALGAAMVRGYQGKDFSGPDHVLACAKHLVAGGVPDNGLNGATAELSERTLEEVFFPPFVAALSAGAYTVMPSHNDVNGVPCHADADLLGRRLRGEWGLSGFVVSDWLDVARLHSVHAIAETRKEADRLALSAGVDMHMHGGEFFDNVLALVREGAISEARIDAAVLPILYAKFQLGLFERRYSEPARIRATLRCPAHLAVALEASRKSLVLLTNSADVLPLRNIQSLCVTGPDADDQSILGDWARLQPAEHVVTVKQGLLGQAPPGLRVEYVATGPIAQISDAQIAAAVKAAARTDVTVVVIGENSLRDNPERSSGENVDRASLEPPGRQLELVRALVATGKPVVAVLINGAPIASEWLIEHAAAVLEAWEPGALGGQAIAEALFGKLNPSGRLPMSVPRSTGHLKSYYNHRPAAHHRGKYRFTSHEPLFSFGHGLSYTRFEYALLRSRDELSAGEELVVELDVKNAGACAGEDIVLLFVRDVFASVTRPVKELRAFERVALEPGEKKTVRFVLGPDAFSLFDRQLKKKVEPGEFRLLIGLGGPEKSVWITS